MHPLSKICVIGGTGKSGKFVIRQLNQLDIPFQALVRNGGASGLSPNQVIQGDVRDPEFVLNAIEGCSAVISTLGQPKGEPSIFSQATRNILAAMQRRGIQRYILTTGLNVDTPFDRKGALTRAGTEWMRANYPETTADKQLEYELLAASPIDWTLVRLPLIDLSEESGAIAISVEDCPGTKIRGKDLAEFLIRQLGDKDYLQKAPFLANKNSP